MDRSAPRLEEETPQPMERALLDDIEQALRQISGTTVTVDGRSGPAAVVVLAVLPVGRRAHEVFVFTRGAPGSGAHERAIDYLGGLVEEMARKGGPAKGYHLPLDWEGRPYDGDVVFVRGEVRDYAAEEEAARLLEEPPPPRGLDGPTVH